MTTTSCIHTTHSALLCRFLLAGQEPMNMALSWTLFALTQAPEVQRKLREELLAVPTATPTMDELSALPYLDCVVREALRVYPPIATTLRAACRDDVLPVSEPFVDRYGNVQNEIRQVASCSIMLRCAQCSLPRHL